MQTFGFQMTNTDRCLYITRKAGTRVFSLPYVLGPRATAFIPRHYYIQKQRWNYLEKFLERFNMENYNPVEILIKTKMELPGEAETYNKEGPYRDGDNDKN